MVTQYYIIFQAHPRTVENCKLVQQQFRDYQRWLDEQPESDLDLLSALPGENDGYVNMIMQCSILPNPIPSTCHFFKKRELTREFAEECSAIMHHQPDLGITGSTATHIPTGTEFTISSRKHWASLAAKQFLYSALFATGISVPHEKYKWSVPNMDLSQPRKPQPRKPYPRRPFPYPPRRPFNKTTCKLICVLLKTDLHPDEYLMHL